MRLSPIAAVVVLLLPIAGRTSTPKSAVPSTSSALLPFQPSNDLERQWYDSYRRAYALDQQHRYTDAAEGWDAALALARQAGCASCELRTLANAAGQRVKAMQYREAMAAFLEAKALARRLGDRQMAGVIALNLSNLYLQRFALEQAAAAANESTGLLQDAQMPWLRAKALVQQARLTARRGDMEGAARIYSDIISAAQARVDFPAEAQAWEHLGLEHWRRGELDAAEAALTLAFRLRKLNGDKALAASYHSLALVRLAREDAHSAYTLADRAAQEWIANPSVRPLWQIRLTRGQALAALGRTREALADLDAALDQIRAEGLEVLPADSLRIQFGAGSYDVWAARIETGVEAGLANHDAALIQQGFALAEEARARSLRQASGDREQTRRRLPAEYYRALERLQAEQIELMKRPGAASLARLGAARRELGELESAAEIEAGGAKPYRRPGALPRVAPDSALFSFYVGERRSYLWLQTRERLRVWRMPPRRELQLRVERFVERIARGGSEAAADGAALYRLLFAEAAPYAAGKKRWLLSLDGPLLDLPFAALVAGERDGRPVYLIEERPLELTPGAWAAGGRPQALHGDTLLAVGDPVYNSADPRWAGARQADPLHLPRLAASAREIRACARAWIGAASLLEGPAAGWNALRRRLAEDRPAAVHLAAHFVPSPDHPGQTVLALGLNPDGVPQYAGPEQVAAAGMAGGLVVMSGCGSGNGRTLAGEGRVGLARAWLLGGASSVVATYWPTPDDSGEFLESFYRHLRETPGQAVRPGDALRKAQMQMIRSGSWQAEPRHWASHFIITKS